MAGYVGTKAVLLSTTAANVGGAASVGAGLTVNNDGATVLTVDRATSDGTIIDVQKSGSSVGSIGVTGGDLMIGQGSVGIRFLDSASALYPTIITNGSTASDIDIGTNGANFKDLYLSGGIQFDSRSNKLDDYEEGTWTPSMAGYSGVTYGTRVGYYTKVGRMIMANFEMDITSIGTYTSNTHISGWPFSAGISNTAACGVQLTVMTALNETRNEHYGALYNGGSSFFIYNRNGTARNGNVHQAGKYAGTLIYKGY